MSGKNFRKKTLPKSSADISWPLLPSSRNRAASGPELELDSRRSPRLREVSAAAAASGSSSKRPILPEKRAALVRAVVSAPPFICLSISCLSQLPEPPGNISMGNMGGFFTGSWFLTLAL